MNGARTAVKGMTVVGWSLCKLRETARLSLDELAKLAGTSVSYLASIERGDTTPSTAFTAHVAGILADVLEGGATWMVTNRSGWALGPGSLQLQSLCNADEARTGSIDRSRYIITAAVPRPAPVNAWDRCSGSISTY